MVIFKRILQGVAALLGIAIVVTGIILASDWLYYKRLITFDPTNSMTNMAWYEPVVEVSAGLPPAIPIADPSVRTIPQETLDAAVAFAVDNKSMALLIWHRGALQLEWYGDGFDQISYMESASMHKSVMALLFGIAIDDGFIPSVDEPASTYLTEWQNDERSKITIRNMLQMAHGLSRAPGGFSPLSDNMKLSLGTDWGGIALKAPAEDPPGTVFAYSNLNSQLLGLILQRATGIPYAEFLETRLWSHVAESSAWAWLDRPDGLAKTSGSLFTPARNWLRMGLLHLNSGKVGDVQVVPEAWIAEVKKPSPTNPNYGFQTWLGTEYMAKRDYGKGVPAYVPHSEPFVVDDLIFFDGSGGQRVYVSQAEELVIIRTGEGGLDFQTGAFKWDDAFLPNLIIRGIRSQVSASSTP